MGEIVKRGTNYVTVVQEDFALQKIWLEDVVAIEKRRTELPEAINFIKNRNLWEKYHRENKKEYLNPNKKKKLLQGAAKIKETPEMVSSLTTKFKIPSNVAEAIVKSTVNAGINPLEIKSYSTLLSTYMNLMDEKIDEVAPIVRVAAKVLTTKMAQKAQQKKSEKAGQTQTEVAPPGKEKVVKALKKKWPDNLKRVYATAWYQYNKEKGKND